MTNRLNLSNMLRMLISCSIICTYLLYAGAQQAPSRRIAEISIKAGASYPILVTLPEKTKVPIHVAAVYTLQDPNRKPSIGGSGLNDSIDCAGDAPESANEILVICNSKGNPQAPYLPQANNPGEYVSDGYINITTPVAPNSERFKSEDFPIVHLLPPDPSPHAQLPTGIAGVMLYPDRKLTLEAQATSAQELFNELSSTFPVAVPDKEQNRQYLIGVALRGKGVVETARQRLVRHKNAIPSFFADLDTRFDQVIKELNEQKADFSTKNFSAEHLERVQYTRPHISTEVTATDQPSKLDHPLKQLGLILYDQAIGLLKIALDDTDKFTFSIVSVPDHASVYVSSPSQPKERQLGGETNFPDTKLDYALWTFRLELNGCSEQQVYDPYLQNPIPMKFDMARCIKR